jgi:hypothetical protein
VSIVFAGFGLWLTGLTVNPLPDNPNEQIPFTYSWGVYSLAEAIEVNEKLRRVIILELDASSDNVMVSFDREVVESGDWSWPKYEFSTVTWPGKVRVLDWTSEQQSLQSDQWDHSINEDDFRLWTSLDNTGQVIETTIQGKRGVGSFVWIDGLKRINFSKRRLFIRFGDVVDPTWQGDELVIPYGDVNVYVAIPPNMMITSENPAPFYSRIERYRDLKVYNIKLGVIDQSPLPNKFISSSDLDLVIEAVNRNQWRDYLILLAGLSFGLSSSFLAEMLLSHVRRRWSSTESDNK